VAGESIGTGRVGSRWFIDLEWFGQNNRSFFALARGCLCPRCRERLTEGEISSPDLLATIKDCCAKVPGFINGNLTILESVFRLFLSNGDQPLDLGELSRQLSELRGGDIYAVLAEVLPRLLKDEQYYGIRQFPS